MRQFYERAAINAPIQGSAADILRRAMVRMDEVLENANLDAQMLLQVHDELIFELPEDQVDETKKTRHLHHGKSHRPSPPALGPPQSGSRSRPQLGRGALAHILFYPNTRNTTYKLYCEFLQ